MDHAENPVELPVKVHRIVSDSPTYSTSRTEDDVVALLEEVQEIFHPAGVTLCGSLGVAPMAGADIEVAVMAALDPQRLIALSPWDSSAVNVFCFGSLGGKNCIPHRGTGAVLVADKTSNSAARALAYGLATVLGMGPTTSADGLMTPGGSGTHLGMDDRTLLLKLSARWLERRLPAAPPVAPFCCEGPYLTRFVERARSYLQQQGTMVGLFRTLLATRVGSTVVIDDSGRQPWIEWHESGILVHSHQHYERLLQIGDRLTSPSLELATLFGTGSNPPRLAQPSARIFALLVSVVFDWLQAGGLSREGASLMVLLLHYGRYHCAVPLPCLIQRYCSLTYGERIQQCCQQCGASTPGSLALQAQVQAVTEAIERLRPELLALIKLF